MAQPVATGSNDGRQRAGHRQREHPRTGLRLIQVGGDHQAEPSRHAFYRRESRRSRFLDVDMSVETGVMS